MRGSKDAGSLDVGEPGADAEPGKVDAQERLRSPVEARARDDVLALFGQGRKRDHLGRQAGGHEHGPDSAFEGGDALLDDVCRGVRDSRVNVARLFEGEQPGGVIRALENIRRGLIDGDRPRARDRVGRLSPVKADCIEMIFCFIGHDVNSPFNLWESRDSQPRPPLPRLRRP